MLLLLSAVALYLEQGPRFLRTLATNEAGQGEVLRLLREPRLLPDIRFTNGEGRPTRLSHFRGKVILLNVWATWCLPCRIEMSALDRLQVSLGGLGFEVVAVSIDSDGLAAVKLFNLQNNIRHLPVYIDQSGQVMSGLGVAAIRTTLLIDRNGNEIGRTMGPAEWDGAALIKTIRNYLDAPAIPTDLSGRPTLH